MALVTRRAAVWVVRRCRMMEHSTVTHDLNAGGGSTPPVCRYGWRFKSSVAGLFRRRAVLTIKLCRQHSAYCPGYDSPAASYRPQDETTHDDSFEAFGRLTWRNPETQPQFAGQHAASSMGFAMSDPEPEVVLITIRARAVE